MKPNYINVKEFTDFGYLQEVNRRFFHPLGLAMTVEEEENGTTVITGIQDWCSDPEGGFFCAGVLNKQKQENVDAAWYEKLPVRLKQQEFLVSSKGIQLLEEKNES